MVKTRADPIRVDPIHRRMVARIRSISARRKVALTHLPDHAAVARSHFWNIMAGRKSPTLRWLVKIANALDVDVEDLLARSPK